MSNLDVRDAHPLWQFSLDVYAMPGVQAECLLLQDAHGIDVNVLLYCTWVGACGRRSLTSQDIVRAREAVAAWQSDVVQPLRAARRAAKRLAADAGYVRASIAEAELAAERVEQDMLFALAPAASQADGDFAQDCVHCNIGLLLAYSGSRDSPFPKALAAAALTDARQPAPRAPGPHRQTG